MIYNVLPDMKLAYRGQEDITVPSRILPIYRFRLEGRIPDDQPVPVSVNQSGSQAPHRS